MGSDMYFMTKAEEDCLSLQALDYKMQMLRRKKGEKLSDRVKIKGSSDPVRFHNMISLDDAAALMRYQIRYGSGSMLHSQFDQWSIKLGNITYSKCHDGRYSICIDSGSCTDLFMGIDLRQCFDLIHSSIFNYNAR